MRPGRVGPRLSSLGVMGLRLSSQEHNQQNPNARRRSRDPGFGATHDMAPSTAALNLDMLEVSSGTPTKASESSSEAFDFLGRYVKTLEVVLNGHLQPQPRSHLMLSLRK